MLTAADVKVLLDYNPVTGLFHWIKNGKQAGCVFNSGYVLISINNKRYMAHRLAWLVQTGSWPQQYIDHINGIRTDNRIANLRECTTQQNHRNRKAGWGSSRYKGVSWAKSYKKWAATITVDGKPTRIGLFDTEIEAHHAYVDAATERFGDFANPGLSNVRATLV